MPKLTPLDLLTWLLNPLALHRRWLVMHIDLGGDSPPPPDYSPMAQASEQVARIGAQLGREQLAEGKRQYDSNMAVARPIVDAQGKLMQQSYDQGGSNFRAFQEEGRPLQQLLRDGALGIVSPQETQQREEAASRGVADVGIQLDAERAETLRSQNRRGVNPSSGRAAALSGVMDLGAATAKAGAANVGRTQASAKFRAGVGDTFNTYAGLGSSAPVFYAAGTAAGSSAVGNQNTAGAQYINSMASGNQTIMQGQGQRLQGLGSILNSQSSIYSSATAAEGESQGAMIGGIATIGAAMI